MRQIAKAQAANSAPVDISTLPEVELPDLSQVVARVPTPAPFTAEDIQNNYEALYYEHCVEREWKQVNDPVELGDEVYLDLVTYSGGKIMPFGSRESMRLRLESDSYYPGFGDALAGTKVGANKLITLQLPDAETQRNVKVVFIVDVKGATKLTFPPIDAPETVKKLGLGDGIETVEQAYDRIAEVMKEERDNEMLIAGTNAAVQAIIDLVNVEIPSEVIDTEIREQWNKTEAVFLKNKGLSRQDLDESLAGWIADEGTRKAAADRVRNGLAVAAYAKKENDPPTEKEVEEYFRDFAKTHGVSYEEWRRDLESREDDQLTLLNMFVFLRTTTRMIAEIDVQFGDQPND